MKGKKTTTKGHSQGQHNGSLSHGVVGEDVEVSVPKVGRKRQLTAAYKRRVLEELAELPYGETGAYLRREGLYSSQVAKWRKQLDRAGMAGLAAQKRGPEVDEMAKRVAMLERENEQLRSQIAQAELIITVQKKLARTLESITQSSGEK